MQGGRRAGRKKGQKWLSVWLATVTMVTRGCQTKWPLRDSPMQSHDWELSEQNRSLTSREEGGDLLTEAGTVTCRRVPTQVSLLINHADPGAGSNALSLFPSL